MLDINRADALFDDALDWMIQAASDQVRKLTGREFTKLARTEYHTSYETYLNEPDPQYIFTNSWPIDTGQPLKITYAAYERHTTAGIELTNSGEDPDYVVDAEDGVIMVQRVSGRGQQPLHYGYSGVPITVYAPRGFKVEYTGGYELTPDPATGDPLDEFGIPQIPDGLKFIIAQKVATDFLAAKQMHASSGEPQKFKATGSAGMLKPWTEEQRETLAPYRRRKLLGS